MLIWLLSTQYLRVRTHTNLKWFSRKGNMSKGCISRDTQYPCSRLRWLDPQRKDPEKQLIRVSGTVVKLLTVPG